MKQYPYAVLQVNGFANRVGCEGDFHTYSRHRTMSKAYDVQAKQTEKVDDRIYEFVVGEWNDETGQYEQVAW